MPNTTNTFLEKTNEIKKMCLQNLTADVNFQKLPLHSQFILKYLLENHIQKNIQNKINEVPKPITASSIKNNYAGRSTAIKKESINTALKESIANAEHALNVLLGNFATQHENITTNILNQLENLPLPTYNKIEEIFTSKHEEIASLFTNVTLPENLSDLLQGNLIADIENAKSQCSNRKEFASKRNEIIENFLPENLKPQAAELVGILERYKERQPSSASTNVASQRPIGAGFFGGMFEEESPTFLSKEATLASASASASASVNNAENLGISRGTFAR